MAPRETENNADAKFWGDKQRALRYVMVFSGVVNLGELREVTREHHANGDMNASAPLAARSFAISHPS